MPPPGVPNWLFPTMVLHTVGAIDREGAGGPTFTLWVESVSCVAIDPTGEVGVTYRPLRLRENGWFVGMPSVVPLRSFLRMVRDPEDMGEIQYLSPPHVRLDPEVDWDEREEDLGPGEQVPLPTPSAELMGAAREMRDRLRIGMLGMYLSMCEAIDRQSMTSPQCEGILAILRDRLGITVDPEAQDPNQEVWDALESLLTETASASPREEPRTRFERDPLV